MAQAQTATKIIATVASVNADNTVDLVYGDNTIQALPCSKSYVNRQDGTTGTVDDQGNPQYVAAINYTSPDIFQADGVTPQSFTAGDITTDPSYVDPVSGFEYDFVINTIPADVVVAEPYMNSYIVTGTANTPDWTVSTQTVTQTSTDDAGNTITNDVTVQTPQFQNAPDLINYTVQGSDYWGGLQDDVYGTGNDDGITDAISDMSTQINGSSPNPDGSLPSANNDGILDNLYDLNLQLNGDGVSGSSTQYGLTDYVPTIVVSTTAPGGAWKQLGSTGLWYHLNAAGNNFGLQLVTTTATATTSGAPAKAKKPPAAKPKPKAAAPKKVKLPNKTIGPTAIRSYSSDGESETALQQARWTSRPDWVGFMWYANEIQNQIVAHKTAINTVTITLHRQNDGTGWNRKVPVKLGLHNNGKTPNAGYAGQLISSTASIGIAPGATINWQIPQTWVNHLKNGDATGFMILGSGHDNYLTLGGNTGNLLLTYKAVISP